MLGQVIAGAWMLAFYHNTYHEYNVLIACGGWLCFAYSLWRAWKDD